MISRVYIYKNNPTIPYIYRFLFEVGLSRGSPVISGSIDGIVISGSIETNTLNPEIQSIALSVVKHSLESLKISPTLKDLEVIDLSSDNSSVINLDMKTQLKSNSFAGENISVNIHSNEGIKIFPRIDET